MASFTIQQSAFLAAPAVSSLEQARASTTVVSLPAVSVKRNASMVAVAALSRKELESKPLSQLRAIARVKGIVAGTKDQIIAALTGGASSPAAAAQAAAADSNEAFLQAKTLGELRALAKEKGLRGDTKAEIIKLLLSAGVGSPAAAPAPVTYSAEALATVTPVTISTDDYAKRLQTKPLSKLRAVARMRGVTGTTRAELVKNMLAYHAKAIVAEPCPTAAAEAAEDKDEIVDHLEDMTLGELRALARERGVRGDTRAELIKLLTSAPKKAASAAPIPTYTNGAAAAAPSYSPASAASAAPASSVRDLSTKSLAQLRAMAAQRGIRGATKQELVKALAVAL